MIKVPKGARAITAIDFDKTSTFIACADLSNDHNIRVYKVEDGSLVFERASGPDKIFMCQYSFLDETICTVGPNHIYFWNGATGVKKKGIFGANPNTNFA